MADELLEINGNSTEGMLHSDAITIIKHGGDIVQLIIRRLPEHLRQYSELPWIQNSTPQTICYNCFA